MTFETDTIEMRVFFLFQHWRPDADLRIEVFWSVSHSLCVVKISFPNSLSDGELILRRGILSCS
jgi:hypothetical protein